MMAALVKHRVEGLLPCARLAFGRFYSQSLRDPGLNRAKISNVTPRFIPPKNAISPFIAALSRYYQTPPALGLQGKYATLVRELSEFGDTVGVLDAHHALLRRNVPFHFDVFQTMLHHFARIGDLDKCFNLLQDAVNIALSRESLAKETNNKLSRKMLFNAMLLALIENKRWDWCDQVLAEMKKRDVQWDEATCLLLARMRLQSGNPGQMKEVLNQARTREVRDIDTVYNYVLMHTTNETEKQAIQNEMKEHQISVVDVTSHPLVSAPMPESQPTPALTPTEQQEDQAQMKAGQSATPEQKLDELKQQDTQRKTEQPAPLQHEELSRQHDYPSTPSPTNPPPIQNSNIPLSEISPPFPMPLPFPNALYPPAPYAYTNPPPFPYPEFYNQPTQDRIILNVQSIPPPESPILPPTTQAPMFTTREKYNQAIFNSPNKERKRFLIHNMMQAKIMPDESTIRALVSTYRGTDSTVNACYAWSDFTSVNCEQILPKLAPLLVPKAPFNWRHVLAAFKNGNIKSTLAYDELLSRMAQPGALQDVKDLLVVMANDKIAASKEAIVSVLSNTFGGSLQDLETLLSWLIEHGAFLDHTAYRDLAQRISSSSSPNILKRDAIIFLHRTMKQRRIVPDYAFFATALHSVMACSDPEPCAPMLLSMKSAGVRMDQPLYSLLTVFLLRCGEVALAEQVDEDMRTGATEQQVALHYGYLRAFQDRGELAGVNPNTVIPGLEVYYQQQSLPYPLRFPVQYPLPPSSANPTPIVTSPPSSRSLRSIKNQEKKARQRAAKQAAQQANASQSGGSTPNRSNQSTTLNQAIQSTTTNQSTPSKRSKSNQSNQLNQSNQSNPSNQSNQSNPPNPPNPPNPSNQSNQSNQPTPLGQPTTPNRQSTSPSQPNSPASQFKLKMKQKSNSPNQPSLPNPTTPPATPNTSQNPTENANNSSPSDSNMQPRTPNGSGNRNKVHNNNDKNNNARKVNNNNGNNASSATPNSPKNPTQPNKSPQKNIQHPQKLQNADTKASPSIPPNKSDTPAFNASSFPTTALPGHPALSPPIPSRTISPTPPPSSTPSPSTSSTSSSATAL